MLRPGRSLVVKILAVAAAIALAGSGSSNGRVQDKCSPSHLLQFVIPARDKHSIRRIFRGLAVSLDKAVKCGGIVSDCNRQI